MISFKGSDRSQTMLMLYDMSEWLPEDHLARFVVDITDRMDFSGMYARYTGKGKQPYDPKLLVSLLFYNYSAGVFSSRKSESATYDSVARISPKTDL